MRRSHSRGSAACARRASRCWRSCGAGSGPTGGRRTSTSPRARSRRSPRWAGRQRPRGSAWARGRPHRRRCGPRPHGRPGRVPAVVERCVGGGFGDNVRPRGTTMNRALRGVAVAVLLVLTGMFAGACGGDPEPNIPVERLPDVRPNLPEVPTIPPPPHPVQYPDSTYSVYGIRRRMAQTLNTEASITGYIVEIYIPPECPEGRTCPPAAAPHMWIADVRGEADDGKRLMVVGYAENQAQIDEAIDLARRGRTPELDPENPTIPIPVDFVVGAKIKATGRFARISGA